VNLVGMECKYLYTRILCVVCVIPIRLIVFYCIGHVFYCKDWVRIIISLLYWVRIFVCLRFIVLCFYVLLYCVSVLLRTYYVLCCLRFIVLCSTTV
jgi:hypothetical protein